MRSPGAAACQPNDAREVIDRQVTHLARLVDDLLDVSRVTQGKITLVRLSGDWVDIVKAGIELCRPLIDPRHHERALLLPPRGTVLSHGDPSRLAQVVGNLVTNAARHTGPGGRIEVKLMGASGEATLEVADCGLGIASKELPPPPLFDLFVQAERSLERAQWGARFRQPLQGVAVADASGRRAIVVLVAGTRGSRRSRRAWQ